MSRGGLPFTQPDDLITSWAQYKAFTSHAEKFNKAPEDVVGKGGEESVKVVHGGPGTHGAGGGGSGGGAIGAGGHDKEGVESGTRQSDIVDGGPKDYGRYRDNEKMKQGIKEQQGQGHAPQPVGSEGVDPGEKERRVPSSGEQGFHSWEIEEMENLLKEVRGTLGTSLARDHGVILTPRYSHVLYQVPRGRGPRQQLLVQRAYLTMF